MKKQQNRRPMTPNMKRLLQFISDFYTKHDYMPTFEQMKKEMGYKSKNSITQLIEKLEERKDIRRLKGYRRNLELNV